jgi:hypothetical protein
MTDSKDDGLQPLEQRDEQELHPRDASEHDERE